MKLHKPTITGETVSDSSITALSFIKVGGTALQYLMADGSVSLGGPVGNLQNITDNGNSTTNDINLVGSKITIGSVGSFIYEDEGNLKVSSNQIFNYAGTLYSQLGQDLFRFGDSSRGTAGVMFNLLGNFAQFDKGNFNGSGILNYNGLTGNRTWALPDASGTIALLSDIVGVNPDLQSVTDIGNSTTNILQSTNTVQSYGSSSSYSKMTNQGVLYLSLTSMHSMSIVGFQGKITSKLNSTRDFTLQFPTAPAGTYTQNLQSKAGTIALLEDLVAYEPKLGNPAASGYILSSTASGARSWIPAPSGGSSAYPTTFAWSNGTSAGPTGSLTGVGMPAVSYPAIPSASSANSGVITNGAQTIGGVKTFVNTLNVLNASIVVTAGGVSSQGNMDTNGFFVVNNSTGGYKITGKGSDDILLASGGTTSLSAITGGASAVTSVTGSGAISVSPTTGAVIVYHATTSGYKHIPTGGSTGQILKYLSDGTAQWATPTIGTVTSVIAGAGMTQSGVSTVNPTLNVIGGNGIVANADNIQLGPLTANWNGGSTYTITANDFIGSSDKRAKEFILPLPPQKLKTSYKSFNFKGNSQKRFGVIAQELEKNHDVFVRTDEHGIKSVSYIDLHSAEIAYLKYKVEQLSNLIYK